MSRRVELQARSGAALSGELAEPVGTGAAPAVVLLQEWWGVNDHIRSLVDRLAAAGFLALAPDLYHGAVTANADEAGRLMGQLDWARAIDDIAGAAAYLKRNPRSNGKVGVTGFCLGGALTFAAATRVPEFAAAVPFYGVPDPSQADYSKLTAPVLAHFASRDDWAKPEAAKAVKAQLEKLGRSMELHVYEADHAFVNDTRPEVYDDAAAKLAWQRTVEFFGKHLR